MADSSRGNGEQKSDGASDSEARLWERPTIAWREPYGVMSFGASCSRVPGNPPCFPGPYRK